MVSERLENVRDLFIFSCFTGLAYIDVANLTQDNIRKSFDGNLWIITKRQKDQHGRKCSLAGYSQNDIEEV